LKSEPYLQLCGHGIGKSFHCPPDIYHTLNNYPGSMLPGMVFTIEPCVSEGGTSVQILEDGWTITTKDNSRTAQFEHTILINEVGIEILTLWATSPSVLFLSELFSVNIEKWLCCSRIWAKFQDSQQRNICCTRYYWIVRKVFVVNTTSNNIKIRLISIWFLWFLGWAQTKVITLKTHAVNARWKRLSQYLLIAILCAKMSRVNKASKYDVGWTITKSIFDQLNGNVLKICIIRSFNRKIVCKNVFKP